MVRLGLSIEQSSLSYAMVDGKRLTRSGAIPASGGLQKRVDAIVNQVGQEVRKLGRKLTSVSIVTDEVLTRLQEGRALEKVALFRLSSPEGHESHHLIDPLLSGEIVADFDVLKGGRGFDGRFISQPDPAEIEASYRKTKAIAGSFVVSSPFSILFPDHEEAAGDELKQLGAERVWLSSEVSSMPSILDRETTAILSAATSGIISELRSALSTALAKYGSKPIVYFGRNNGSLMSQALAERFPLETAWGVHGHSASGVAFLEKIRNGTVLGTTGGHIWLTGVSDGKPIMRRISYLRDMLLHVSSPVVAELLQSAEGDVAVKSAELLGHVVGSARVYAVGSSAQSSVPLDFESTPKLEAAAATNAALARLAWEGLVCLPVGSNIQSYAGALRDRLARNLKEANARGVRFGRLLKRPGYNLPEGTTTLSLDVVGIPA